MQTDPGAGRLIARPEPVRRGSPRWPRLVVATVLVIAVAAVGCAPAGDASDEQAEQAQEPATPDDLATKPDMAAVLTADRGEPPAALTVDDLVAGDGAAARSGDVVTVHYVGAAWSSGVQFDASWDRGQPYTFTLGAGEVIAGWEQGMPGMRVGGRRVLTIPPDLAYGDRGAGRDIPPGETIVFVVDLLDVT